MHRRDSESTLSKLVLLAAAASLSGCASFAPHSQANFPKFADIPLAAQPTDTTAQAQAGVTDLKAQAVELASQPQGNPNQQADDAAIAAARAVASQVQAPTDADDAASQAFARQARARATPPPRRNK
jgi:hypothetical protein